MRFQIYYKKIDNRALVFVWGMLLFYAFSFLLPCSQASVLNDMPNTVMGKTVIESAWGTMTNSVGGSKEDKANNTDGFPPAFDLGSDNRLYILDSANHRVMISNAGKHVAQLFSYPEELCATDITVSYDTKKIALSDQTEKSVFIFNNEGKILEVLKAVYPSSISYTNTNKLLVHNYSKDSLMIFNQDNTLSTELQIEGISPKPIKGVNNKLYKIDKHNSDEPVLKQLSLDGFVEKTLKIPLVFHKTDRKYYHCNSRVIGADEKNGLYIEHLVARDIDETHEQHRYVMAILRVDLKTWEITSRTYVEPFRELESLVAPRQYQPHSEGGVLTYFIDTETGYSIHHIEKSSFRAIEN